MKNIFLTTALLLSYFITSYASTATVGGAGANYATLKAAFDAVNNGTLTGDVVLQITGNTTEVNSASLNATGVGNANYNKVLIYPTVAATITGAMNNNLVTLNGADSVTIDGRINQQGANTDLTFTNTNVGTGASTITFQISAKYNVVQYCKLLGATTSNNLGIVSFLNPGATGTGNDYNKISHCEITENTSGMPRIGIYSEGTQGLSGQNNDNNTIEYNKIYNFFNSASTLLSAGIVLYNYTSKWTITNNSIYQTASRTGGQLSYLVISGAPPYGGSYTISNNFIGGLDENANGLFTTTGTMNPLSILISDTMPSQFSNNKIRGVQFPVGNSEGIRIFGNVTLDGNTLSDFTISVNGTSLTSFTYTFMLGNDSAKFINNNVSNVLLKNLYNSNLSTETLTVSKNFKLQVGNTFSNFTTYHPSNSFNTLIMSNKEVSSNTFKNITNSVCISGQISTATVAKNNYFKNLINSTGIQTCSSVIGNEFLNCTGTCILSCTSVISNTINNLTKGTMISKCDEIHRNFIATDNVQGGTVLYGISSNKKIKASNNIIRIRVGNQATNTQVYGIYSNSALFNASAVTEILNNTIIIEGNFNNSNNTSVSSGIFFQTDVYKIIKNNLFKNDNYSATINSYCIDIPSMYITTLDYNNYFVNGSNGFLAKIGGSSYSTLLTLQNGTLQEANGNVSDPLFASPLSSSPYGYIIQSTLPGTPLTQVPTDYFGNVRPATPSMGAIEYGSAQPFFSDSTVAACDYFKYKGDSIIASGTYTYSHYTGQVCDTVFSLFATITESPVAPIIRGPNNQTTGIISICGVNGYTTLYGNIGGTWNNNSTNTSIQVTQPGNYYVVKTNGSCTDTSNVLTVAQFPTLNSASVMITTSLTNTNIICQGASVTFTAYPINGGTAPVYIWSKNNNLLVSGANYSTYTTNSISNGDIFRCAINSNYPCLSNNASVFSNPITIFTNSVPALAISTPNGTDFCAGQSVMLSAPAGTSYLWSNGDTTQQISVSQAGSYFVNVSNPSGCTGSVVSSNSVAITSSTSVPVASNISASGSTTFCAGGSVVLSGNNGGVWSNGATTFSITANQAGTYFVTKSNACGSDTSNSLSVTVNPSVFNSTSISASNTNVCSGTPVTFTATTVNGGTSPTYVWKKNGVIITGATNSTYTASGITNGNTFTCMVTSNETCASPATSTSNSIAITVGSGPSASISAPNGTTFCTGQSITLTANSGSAYLWSNGATSQSISPNSSGNYSVIVTNPGGCNGSATSNAVAVFEGTAPAAPTISASGNTTFCAGSSVTLSGNSGGTWSNNATSATISVNTSGTYYLTYTNICGSATSNSILVTVNSLPAVSISSTASTVCAGTSVTLTGIGASSYVWNNGVQDGVAFTPTATSTYTVVGTNANNCTNTASANIAVNALPSTPIVTQNGNILSSTSATLYQWQINGTDIAGATQQQCNITQDGNYTVVVYNANGCSKTSAIVIVNPTSLETITNRNDEISIFPNPATSTITIKTPITTQLSIQNLLGETLLCNTVQNNSNIDISHFTKGIYIAKTKSGQCIKVVKE